jgi:hypothetical protein
VNASIFHTFVTMDLDHATLPAWLLDLHTRLAPVGDWREVSIAGAYVPTLMLLFALSAVLTWAIDAVLARLGAYRFLWHPPLFRVSLFTCLLSVAGLALYG